MKVFKSRIDTESEEFKINNDIKMIVLKKKLMAYYHLKLLVVPNIIQIPSYLILFNFLRCQSMAQDVN